MFFSRPAGYKWIDRGEVAVYDKAIGDITADGTYRELDLSAIVPKNAKRISIHFEVKTPAQCKYAGTFDEYGKTVHKTFRCGSTFVADTDTAWDFELAVSSNGKILYAAAPTCTVWNLCVGGWWI